MAKRAAASEDPNKRLIEAIAGGIGAVLALATLGIIIWDGIRERGRPPVIIVHQGQVHSVENGFVLEIVAENRGGATAAGVVVEGTLEREGAITETSEATFDYIPGGARRDGGLIFLADPREYDVSVRAKGYIDP